MARRRSPSATRALTIGVMSVVGALAVFAMVVFLAGNDDVQSSLGDDEFRVGEVADLVDLADVQPLGYNDLQNGSLAIWVAHEGDDAEGGWRAFSARPPGADGGCAVQWEPAAGEFVDSCTGDVYPADGEGLTRFAVRVEEGVLIVDLRESQAPPP